MSKIKETYVKITTTIICVTALISGVITAEKNTRRICFGEEYNVINLTCVKSYICDILNIDDN